MDVRAYTDADLEAVAAVFTASVHALASVEYDAAQRAAWAPRPPRLSYWRKRLLPLQTLVATEGTNVAGFISYEQNGHIEFLYTAPSYSRRGVASLLYASCERVLEAAGMGELFAEASLVARPFFERFGFVVAEKQDVLIGGLSLRRYVMRKQVTPTSG